MKPLFVIAVLNSSHLRDYKLRQLQNDEQGELEWNKTLKISSQHFFRVINNHGYVSRLTKKKCRYKLSSCSRWKTLKGANTALERAQKNQKLMKELIARLGPVQFHIVDIAEEWNNTIESQILLEKETHNKSIALLEKKLLKN